MIKFLVKKNFFDIWDNLVPTFIANIVFMASVALYLFFVQRLINDNVIFFFVITVLFLLLFSVELLALSAIACKWVRYDNFSWYLGLKGFLKGKLGHLALFFFLSLFIFFCSLIIIPYYLSLRSYIGVILATVLFWVIIILVFSLQYYPSLCYANEKGALRTFKDSLALFFDNKAYSLFVFINSVFLLFLSALSFFMIPGITGLSVCWGVSTKLLLIRNEYAGSHHISKKDIDVRDMLEEESLNLGKRTLRNTLFPWKKEK